jgi:DNA-binding NarL/FixJ family response regulator
MTQRKIRLLLADDHLIVRIGLRSLIETQPDMEVVAEAAGGVAAVAAFKQHKPDIALMDLRMPDLSGAEATAAIRQAHPHACIIVLTTYEHEEDVYQALEAGAAGYLIKNNDSAPLLDAIRKVHAGTYQLTPTVRSRLAERKAAPELTPREREVLLLIVKGQSNKEIGVTLGLAENTVKNHVKMVLEKLQVSDRTQAATTALQRGLVRFPA